MRRWNKEVSMTWTPCHNFFSPLIEDENHLSLLAFLSHDSLLAATSTTCNSNNLSNMFQQMGVLLAQHYTIVRIWKYRWQIQKSKRSSVGQLTTQLFHHPPMSSKPQRARGRVSSAIAPADWSTLQFILCFKIMVLTIVKVFDCCEENYPYYGIEPL